MKELKVLTLLPGTSVHDVPSVAPSVAGSTVWITWSVPQPQLLSAHVFVHLQKVILLY